MSAPAIKSSMPGVGGTPPTTGHSILPMNMMAQKVVQGTETSAMKPMSGTGISYVTLQPPAQPLSLVQDHNRSSQQVYPQTTAITTTTTTTTTTYNVDKEAEGADSKQMPNGLEACKASESEQTPVTTKTVDTVKSNVESGANTVAQDQQPQQPPQSQTQQQVSQSAPIATQQPQQQSQAPLPVSQSPQHSQPAAAPSQLQQQQKTSQTQSQPQPQLPSSEDKTAEVTAAQVGNQTPSVHPTVTKPEEKKVLPTSVVTNVPTTTNSSSKEAEESSTSVTSSKTPATPHKTEESSVTTPTTTTTTTASVTPSPTTPTKAPAESSPQKVKPAVCTTKEAAKEHNAITATPKAEPKLTSSPSRVNKRKLKESAESRAQGLDSSSKSKRKRRRTEPFQSPLPEIAMIVKTLTKPSASKANDDKLIVFYKNEFLAVRNTEGSFYVCQAMQNIYKSSRRIRIRWLSQDKTNGEIYSPDFYDFTDFDCILTNLNLNKIDKNKFQLSKFELLRTENILKRAIDVEAGVSEKPSVTEEHPDGLDLSLYKDESQLKKRKKGSNSGKQKRQRKKSKKTTESSNESESESDESDNEEAAVDKKKSSPTAKKRSSNKALAIAKSVAKGSSRAERAMNRGTKNAESSVNNIPAKTTDKKTVEPKKATSVVAAPKTQNNNGAGNSQQPVTENKSNNTRPKRGTITSSSAVKPRGRA